MSRASAATGFLVLLLFGCVTYGPPIPMYADTVPVKTSDDAIRAARKHCEESSRHKVGSWSATLQDGTWDVVFRSSDLKTTSATPKSTFASTKQQENWLDASNA